MGTIASLGASSKTMQRLKGFTRAFVSDEGIEVSALVGLGFRIKGQCRACGSRLLGFRVYPEAP